MCRAAKFDDYNTHYSHAPLPMHGSVIVYPYQQKIPLRTLNATSYYIARRPSCLMIPKLLWRRLMHWIDDFNQTKH